MRCVVMIVVISITFASAVLAQDTTNGASRLTAEAVTTADFRAQADGCTVTPIACGQEHDGELTVTDCTFNNGRKYDLYEFDGRAGDVVDILVWPIDAQMTNPLAFLLPPSSDASVTPVAFRGPGIWTSYVLASTGKWAIAVGSDDLFASGRYRVRVACAPDGDPSSPQSCIAQELLCGQIITWKLTAQSCGFGDDPNRLYAPYEIYATAGEVLNLRESSTAFTPLFGIYRGGKLLASSSPSGADAVMFYQVPATGFYYVDTTSTKDFDTGGYSIQLGCGSQRSSGCQPPTVVQDPANQSVKYGRSASLSVDARGVGPMHYSWFDDFAPGLPIAFAETDSPNVTIPNVTKDMSVYVKVTTPCGEFDSKRALLAVIDRPRGRAVRH